MKKEGLETCRVRLYGCACAVKRLETQAEIFVADKQQHLKGLFPSLAVVSGASSWARRAGLAATSIFDVMLLRSRK